MNSNKWAMVTGGSDRIGKSIVLQLVKMGYNIIIQYNTNEDKAKKLQKKLQKQDLVCHIIQIDFLNIKETQKKIKDIFNKYNISVVVNNSSSFLNSSILDDGLKTFNKVIKINLTIPYLIIKSFLKIRKKGLIINILDTKITQNETLHLDYLLSKKFLLSATELLAFQSAPKVRINAISPGLILPPEDKDINYLKELSKKIPLKKIGDTNHIQEALKFFIKNKFVTGQNIFLDGGEHLGQKID
ncbi:MAG: SDR family oxidoreductase [Sulfurovum sp.]